MSTLQSERNNVSILKSSSISVTITTIITNPIEVAKTKIQYSPIICPKYPHSNFLQLYRCSCIKFDLKDSFKGLSSNLFQRFINMAFYMQFYQYFRHHFLQKTNSSNATLGSAFLSRIIVSSFLIPIQAFRVRSINSTNQNNIQNYGYGGKVTLARDVLYSCIFWYSIEKLRNKISGGEYRQNEQLKNNIFYFNIFPILISSILASSITTPLDVVKTRIQSGIKLKGSLRRQLAEIYTKEGIVGFFSGIHFRVPRDSLGALLYITGYEYFLKRFSHQNCF